MAKKKNISARDITTEDILSLYEDVVPSIYSVNVEVIPDDVLDRCLKRFVSYDSHYFLMEDPNEHNTNSIAIYSNVEPEITKNYDVSLKPLETKDANVDYEKISKELYDSWVEAS